MRAVPVRDDPVPAAVPVRVPVGVVGCLVLVWIGYHWRPRLRPGDLLLGFFIWYAMSGSRSKRCAMTTGCSSGSRWRSSCRSGSSSGPSRCCSTATGRTARRTRRRAAGRGDLGRVGSGVASNEDWRSRPVDEPWADVGRDRTDEADATPTADETTPAAEADPTAPAADTAAPATAPDRRRSRPADADARHDRPAEPRSVGPTPRQPTPTGARRRRRAHARSDGRRPRRRGRGAGLARTATGVDGLVVVSDASGSWRGSCSSALSGSGSRRRARNACPRVAISW